MAHIEEGQTVGIPSDVEPGPFPDEYLVTIETVEGPISGFVRDENLRKAGEKKGYVRAVVLKVSSDTVTVSVEGSFFTTTGIARLAQGWARSNLQAYHA